MIIFVAAYDRNFGMGYKGGLPWPRMPADKDRLHSLAHGKTIVMGERTYHDYRDYRETYKTEDIYVLSFESKKIKNATVFNSIKQVLDLAKDQEIWVLGGGNLFTQLIGDADKMYITEIDGEFEADTFFPKYNKLDWNVLKEESYGPDSHNPYPYRFLDLERKTS